MTQTFSFIGGVGFVSTVLSPVPPLPITLVPGLLLRKPSDDEYGEIASELRRYGRQGTFLDGSHLYEGEWQWQEDGKAAHYESLPKERWRYHVLQYGDDGSALLRAIRSFVLVEPELKVPLVVFPVSPQTVMMRVRLLGDLGAILRHPALHPDPPHAFGDQQVNEIRSAHEDLEGLSIEFESIHRAVDLLLDLQVLREDSSFRVLGMFAVLELLLTHNPGGKELGDSLTHQIASKIPLIGKRLPSGLPYSAHFGHANEDKIWKGLYSYRSALAHGSKPTFLREQAILKNAENALQFLTSATRRITRHALREPQLYADLKSV
jgi:hypothetical protein